MTPYRSKTTDTSAKRIGRRLLWGAGALLVLAFAVEGGEYGTTDLFTQKGRRAALEAEVAALRAEVETLRAELKAVTNDPARIERIAREEFGMVKGEKEIMYPTTWRTGDAAADTAADARADSSSDGAW